ncbi:MAG: hypothetical protein J6T28_00020 [Paludibacteraceae bacterium]|nr:hypothetical protein [Paludibacteraceae bacterium]MBP5482198.1 hypothetical protein [Paludibacteraceae bacterium]
MKHVIYVSAGDVSVYESQVLELLDYLQSKEIKVTLLQGYKSDEEKKKLEKKLSNHPPVPTVWVKSFSVYPFYKKKMVDSFYKGITSIEGYHEAIFHVRSEYVGYCMKCVFQKYRLNLPMLIDIRGIICEELKYKQKQLKGKRKLLSSVQCVYLKSCYKRLFSPDNMRIAISSVSSAINNYISTNYPTCKYPKLVHSNIAGRQFVFDEGKRREIRQRYGIADNEVLAVCSTGGNAVWQKDHLVVKRLVEMGVRVINLSKINIGIEGCITTTVPFTEMPAMLSAADVAVLWRDDTFINNSASPSKFSEFAAMGLYVIHNKTVQVAVEHIQSTGAGCLVNNEEEINALPSYEELQSQRQRWCEAGLSIFGVDSLGDSYIRKYDQLMN